MGTSEEMGGGPSGTPYRRSQVTCWSVPGAVPGYASVHRNAVHRLWEGLGDPGRGGASAVTAHSGGLLLKSRVGLREVNANEKRQKRRKYKGPGEKVG